MIILVLPLGVDDGLGLCLQSGMNSTLSPAERALMRKIGALGGKARKRKLSKRRLHEIAMMGVEARLAKRNEKS